MIGNSIQRLADFINCMQVGEWYVLDRHDMANIPTNMLTGEPPFSQIMSKVIGGAWEFIIEKDFEYGSVHISRIVPDGQRRHVDFDREHLYRKDADGVYHTIEKRTI